MKSFLPGTTTAACALLFVTFAEAQSVSSFEIRFDESVFAEEFTGPLFVAFSKRDDPRREMHGWFNPPPVLRFELEDIAGGSVLTLGPQDAALHHPLDWADVAAGKWRVQAVARRSLTGREAGLGEGDVYGEPVEIEYDPASGGTVTLALDSAVQSEPFEESERVKLFEFKSPALSKFNGFDYHLRAGVLLPKDYEPGKTYPVVYSVTGFGGTYASIRRFEARASESILEECIIVVPDANNRYGHSVFCDSESIGPWGEALVNELIPALEKQYGGAGPAQRYVTGVSSGGWSSLWLQVAYPEAFAGCWSHVPDPIDFHDFQQIDLYTPLADGSPRNMYVDENGGQRPVARRGDEVMLTVEGFVRREHVLAPGGQIRSFEATFSPLGEDGTPRRVFDVETGVIDHEAAQAWRKYDISHILLSGWKELRPRLAGKIHIYAGEVDTFYLEGAVERFQVLAGEAGLLDDMVVEVIPGMPHMLHPAGHAAMLETIAKNARALRRPGTGPQLIPLAKGSRIVLMGNGLGSRMLHFGHFETGLHLRYPDGQLFVRNMCDEGNTPAFRPHSGRANQLGFPGAEAFHGLYSDDNTADGIGHFETEEEWLTRLAPDVIIAFFGFNESFLGRAGFENFRAELDAFLKHTQEQRYNGKTAPELVLVSPTAFEDRSDVMSVSDGQRENANIAAYTAIMETVAGENGVRFVNAFNASLEWHKASRRPLTSDGALLNDTGYEHLSRFLLDSIFGEEAGATKHERLVHDAVLEKNWFWINDFKIPNGVHVFGRRYDPFGPANYPFEVDKIREMTAIRDEAIWAAAHGEVVDLAARDALTSTLPPVETNYNPGGKNGPLTFLTGEEALGTIAVPEGYAIEQWATEVEFPDLANPVQMAFDDKGRLWVATMPSYPHYRPGDPRPDDKLLILEDTNGDGRADKQTVYADKLHLPMGFELAPEGVYLSQGINLVLLQDKDGDDKADRREIVFSGFDDHDTHHAIGAYCADPSGALMMCEGVFLRTNVETAYGPVRATNGGFYRFAPQRRQLERHAQLSIPNPWGVAFDDWGQHFFLHTSGPNTEWMLPGSIKPRYGVSTPGSKDLIEPDHRVRPTSGIEFLSSRHFPDEVQGDMLLNNSIGFLGTKQHRVLDDGTGYTTRWRQDLTKSSDGNYRPVDLEVAPDGSLYIVDWHNPLIGHMQHNARDPHRDHDHGRIYRITYPGRPLVEPAKIDGASIAQLLDNLKLPEYRSRYRTRRQLRGRDPEEVLPALRQWVAALDASQPRYEHHLLEALWVTWGLDRVDETLLRRLLSANDYRARAAAVRALRYNAHRIPGQVELLRQAARDAHGRVKLEAIAAASWLAKEDGLAVLEDAAFDPQAAEAAAVVKEQNVTVNDGGRVLEISHPAVKNGKVRSVRMTVVDDSGIINLAEMEITSGGRNVTERATLSQSSEYDGGRFPISNLVDGDKDNFSHTNTQKNPWIEARFDTPIAIDQITIWNRPGFENRFSPVRIVFANDEGELAALDVDIAGGEGILADPWIRDAYRTALAHLNNQSIEEEVVVEIPDHLAGDARDQYALGAEIYGRDGHCATCHQPDGNGLQAAGFPPLAGTKWATEDEDRLIKVTLNGLLGPMEVNGKTYPGLVPMTPFGGMLNDEELASVLTYVRNSFGNQASVITAEKVGQVRVATQSKVGFYSPDELEGGAATTSRAFVKMWELKDFEEALQQPLHGRSFDRGHEMFEVAACLSCHNIQGEGRNVGADLSQVGAQYSTSELLRHILDPSATIKDEHRLHAIELDDESRYFGLIIAQDDDTIELAESIQEPENTVFIEKSEVIEITPLKASPMPSGLLVTLSLEEILDLLAYIASNGDETHSAFDD